MARAIKYYSKVAVSKAAYSDKDLDSYKDKLLKLIPAEIVAAFLTLKGVFDAAQGVAGIEVVQWIVFCGLLVIMPWIYWKAYKVKDLKQHIITVIAFIIWVFTIGGPFDQFFLGNNGMILPIKGIIASIILVFFTLLAPLLLPTKPQHP
jgi:hypothetical protein